MCRAVTADAREDAAAPADPKDLGEADAAGSADPFATDLRSFHPASGFFAALPRGEFAVVKRIAPGIHGDVFRCSWARPGCSDEQVSVKKLRSESVVQPVDSEHDERKAHLRLSSRASPCQEDALTEIGVLKYLAEQAEVSPFVLRMRGVFQDRSHVWLVTEFAEGGELFDEVASQGPLPQGRARRYTWELMQAIGHLHSHGIGHRDVSLENVLVKDGGLKLMDFGMAVKTHSACGTPLRYFRAVGKDYYRAPECYVPRADFVDVVVPAGAQAGRVVSAKVMGAHLCDVLLPDDAKPHGRARARVYGYEVPPVDVFSAGVCLFILLTGNPPWGQAALGDSLFSWVLERDVVELMAHWGLPPVAPEIAELLRGMTAPDPAKRWSVDDCLSGSWLGGLGAGAPACAASTA